MAEQIILRAETGRSPGSRESRRIRRRGGVPGIVYGRGMEPVPVTVDHHDLVAALSTEAGHNALINLQVDGETVLTLPRLVERHPYRNLIRHVDFLQISLTEKVSAEVSIHLEGEPAGVAEGGVLSQALASVEIEALPTEIPSFIALDVSGLGLHESRRVADLPQLPGVTYLEDPETVVATVSVPRAVIEEEPEVEEELEGVESEDVAEGAPAEGEPEEEAEDAGE